MGDWNLADQIARLENALYMVLMLVVIFFPLLCTICVYDLFPTFCILPCCHNDAIKFI